MTLWNVAIAVNNKIIVRNISLTLNEGEIQVLMGPNGAGKSTLLSGIMGLPGYRIIKGTIYLNGEVINDLSLYERSRLGLALAFQNPPRMKGVTAHCIIEALEKIYGRWKEKHYYAKLLNIEDLLYKPLNHLSGGEIRRVELFLVLAQRPKFMLLDEPDSGIDIDSLSLIAKVLREAVRNGVGVLLVSHTLAFIEDLNGMNTLSRINLMFNGSIYRSGDPQELIRLLREKGLKGVLGGA